MTAFACRASCRFLAFVLSLLALTTAAHAASPITRENARPGTAEWVLTDPADHEVEGYASATSIQRGDILRLFVSSTDP
ncbi:hypothetical protein FBQ96_14185, partial [Nitrospirales bacterium NOB]|nr:hypothetical protein [Nitrospirales bacterium NOB]